ADDDRRPPDGGDDMNSLYGVYHPYFVRGDVNDDGFLDFVLAFVRRDSDRDSPWFSIVVFSGRGGGGFSPGVFLERDVSLAAGAGLPAAPGRARAPAGPAPGGAAPLPWGPAPPPPRLRARPGRGARVALDVADLSGHARAVSVALPLPLRRAFTYAVPDGLP